MAASIVKTDWGKVPRYQKDSLARALVKAMEAFYEDPKNLKAYEEWLKGEGKIYAESEKGTA